ncbi:hypothetical protein ACIRON_04740 [Nocardioides sp. NPDC101246]|uniref:hypothetical protein n=1 Tax=Nocardioides sp. NPDC101246 TaxID=3364336 RepID=UPI0038000E52
MGRRLRTGDVVRAQRTIPLRFSDRLAGRGVRSGRHGVVIATDGRRARVTFEGRRYGGTGWVRSANLGVVSRAPRPLAWIVPVKAALVVFLGVPALRFVVVHLWTHSGFDGFGTAVGNQMGEGMLAWGQLATADPPRALLYLGFLGVVSKLMHW